MYNQYVIICTCIIFETIKRYVMLRNGSRGRQWLDDVKEWRGSQQWLDDVKEWITRKASKTVVGRCKGMDHEEGQQDSGWMM